MDSRPILFVDAYDSFSNNIIALLETELHVSVVKIYIDAVIPQLARFLARFAGVVLGPGPGTPENPHDVGIMNDIWQLSESQLLPVLGICLGFQSMVLQFGGSIQRLKHPRHGHETTIVSRNVSLFQGLERFRAVQYHSLHAVLGHSDGHEAAEEKLWQPGPLTGQLIPLAWDLDEEGLKDPDDANSTRHPILMGVRHRYKPFYGVQFHPESICSSPEARRIARNWWLLANRWSQFATPTSLIGQAHFDIRKLSEAARNEHVVNGYHRATKQKGKVSSRGPHLEYRELPLGDLDLPSICSKLGICGDERDVVILDSAKQLPGLGIHTVIGLIEPETVRISYSIGSSSVEICKDGQWVTEDLHQYGGSIFEYLQGFMQHRQLHNATDHNCPFWGGLIGYIDYEACLESIQVAPPRSHTPRANVYFVYIEHSIVINHQQKCIFVNSTKANDTAWVDATVCTLQAGHSPANLPNALTQPLPFDRPTESEYCGKIRACQEELRAGNSYELCLTDQTKVHTRPASSWDRYCRLRSVNPAPFGAYLRLGALTLLGSSPERFMHWSRPLLVSSDETDVPLLVSTCQFRPIKGTVKKYVDTGSGNVRRISLEEATAVLSTTKERAENLMIVDLIRHDLAGIVGSGDVHVPSLMSIEEYETVYQLVTVIEGFLYRPMMPPSPDLVKDSASLPPVRGPKTGLNVLAASLPPGSMTGAPKKRSCELLTQIEGEQRRSVYSGVLGYMDIGGRGDFSVVIRTAFKWADEQLKPDEEIWRVGAGGAVTILSTEEGEWEEMLTKLSSVLSLFGKA